MTRRWLDPSLFTDEKLAKATVAERLLFTALIAHQDDDGRLLAHPGYLRSIAFPYDDFTLEQVKEMRDHLAQVNPNVIIYNSSNHEYIQLKRYSRYQRPRYYHPSNLPAPPDWPFKEGNQTVTTQLPEGNQEATEQYTEDGDGGEGKGKGLDLGKGKGLGKGGAGKAPETEKRLTSPSPPPLSHPSLFQALKDDFPLAWGRGPTSREAAYLRDLSIHITSNAGGTTEGQVEEAYREVASMNKRSMSYLGAVLCDHIGIPRMKPERHSRSP